MIKTVSNLKVAFFINFMPPYFVSTWEALAKNIKSLRIYVSQPMESNRPWAVYWGTLDVHIQKSIRYMNTHRHTQFVDKVHVDIPYDTLFSLRKYRPHVIISQDYGMRSIMALVWRSWHREVKIINYFRVTQQTEKGRGVARNLIRRWLTPRANAILVNGCSGERYVTERGAKSENVFHVTSVVDVSRFLQLSIDRPDELAERRLLYIGQLVARKGLEQFLDALTRWAQKNPNTCVEVSIVGDGPLAHKLSNLCDVASNIKLQFFGNVAYGEIYNYFSQNGILVFPTLGDEWGVVVNEALASGLPVLGSLYAQSVESLVTDDETGWTFMPDDESAIYQAIDKALNTPVEKLREMRSNCRKLGSSLTPDYSANQILRAIEYVTQD